MSEEFEISRDVFIKAAQSLNVGVAVIEPEDWSVRYENATFFKWFPRMGEPDEPLTDRIPDLRRDRAQNRLEAGRPYSFEIEIEISGRETPIQVEIKKLAEGENGRLMVECQGLTKQKQAEYMLESYSKMAEKTRASFNEKRTVLSVCCST